MKELTSETVRRFPVLHPQLDENGRELILSAPSESTSHQTWLDSRSIATASVTAPSTLPDSLYSVAFAARENPPDSVTDWARITNSCRIVEPQLSVGSNTRIASGCIVIEPDARIWIVHPSNAFVGIFATYPKGRLESGLTVLTNAVKETFEESGLMVKPIAWLTDIVRSRSTSRYYIARRVTGTPLAAGWETQAVSLVPPARLGHILTRSNDRRLISPLVSWMVTHESLWRANTPELI